jgi:hypothetical protein
MFRAKKHLADSHSVLQNNHVEILSIQFEVFLSYACMLLIAKKIEESDLLIFVLDKALITGYQNVIVIDDSNAKFSALGDKKLNLSSK